MKKGILFLLLSLSISILSACTQNEAYIDPLFPTVDTVNEKIVSLGEVTDVASAAAVSEILEDYQFLDDISKSKINDIQRVIDSIDTATTFLEKNDMTLKVMSFNVRYAEFTEDRIDRVISLILKEDPDIIGVQEATGRWQRTLKKRIGDEYEVLGQVWNDPESGEACNALYKKDKFNLLETNTIWLTDTPYVVSKHPESNCYKMLTYQLLERKSDGQIFLHVNMHLDHEAESARIYQANIVTSWIEETFKNQYPVVITGDFNDLQESEPLKVFFDADYRVTNTYGENLRTFTAYSDEGGRTIDFTFVNDYFPIISYKVCEEKMNEEWISDHNAIVSELLLIPTYDSIEIPEKTEE